MRRLTATLVAGTIALIPAAARGQSLARRVQDAPADASVRFSFTARPGVCGDGDNIISIRDDDSDGVSFIRHRGSFRGYSNRTREDWLRGCEFGPVRVTLDREGGRIADVDTRVAGPATAPGITDLGTVAPAEAVDFLLTTVVDQAGERAAQQAILAATLADSAEAWPRLLEIARDDRHPRDVRRNAVFWVGQAAADRATEGLTSLLGDDSEDLEIRKQAVFALSQRPREEGVPALIGVVRSSREPEIRKSALFWLGQSNDPRAIALFEEILTGK